MQKAFDWVDRDLLFYKLLTYNIDGNIYRCIKALYNHPVASVKVNEYMTDWFPTDSGVKQGDSLSPTLFALFINDLAKEINELGLGIEFDEGKLCILLFADDIVILGEDETQLQSLLKFVENWCHKWKLKINKDKTKIIHFRNKRVKKTEKHFFIDNEEVEILDRYKYLGIILNEHLDFNVTASTLAGAAGRALGGIITKFNSFRNIGFKTYSKLYHSGVLPIMDYCSGVWGYGKYECCDKIQYRAQRYYLGVHQKTPLLALDGDIGWLNCQNRRHIEMFKMWNRLVKMDDTKLTRKIFDYDHRICKNWSREVKSLLAQIGEEDVYTNKSECDIDRITKSLNDSYHNEWRNNIQNKPKLRTYILFKNNYDTEDYVKYCLPRLQRSLLAQIRCGILPLNIETGRFHGLKLEDRLCLLCNLNEIECEFHFVCVCPIYTDIV